MRILIATTKRWLVPPDTLLVTLELSVLLNWPADPKIELRCPTQ
jgi:hypothetical protein